MDSVIEAEINEIPGAIEATVGEARAMAARAAAAMRVRRRRHVYLIGNGSSLYAAMASSYTARSLAGSGDATVIPMPAGDFRAFRPELTPDDVVVGFSSSGEFRDVIQVFESLRGDTLLIAITQKPESSIARLADFTIVGGGGPGRVPVMTRTFASTLAAAMLLLLEFYEADETWFEALTSTADLAASAIREAQARAPQLVPSLIDFDRAFCFGVGSGWAAALESALKLKEVAMVHAEAAESSEMASGPSTMVSDRHLAIAFAAAGPGGAETADLAAHLRAWDVPLLDVGPAASGDWHLPVELPRYDPLAALVLVPPVTLLVNRIAIARGLTPDTPTWRSRYLSQGLIHIASSA